MKSCINLVLKRHLDAFESSCQIASICLYLLCASCLQELTLNFSFKKIYYSTQGIFHDTLRRTMLAFVGMNDSFSLVWKKKRAPSH